MFLLITLVKCWLRVMHEGRSSIRHSNSFLDSFPFTMWLVIGSGFGLTVTWAVCGADRRLESMSMMSSLKDLALLANLPFLTLSIAAHSIDRLRLETRQFWRQTPFLVVSYGITTSCYVGIGTLNCTAGAIRNNGKKKQCVEKRRGDEQDVENLIGEWRSSSHLHDTEPNAYFFRSPRLQDRWIKHDVKQTLLKKKKRKQKISPHPPFSSPKQSRQRCHKWSPIHTFPWENICKCVGRGRRNNLLRHFSLINTRGSTCSNLATPRNGLIFGKLFFFSFKPTWKCWRHRPKLFFLTSFVHRSSANKLRKACK